MNKWISCVFDVHMMFICSIGAIQILASPWSHCQHTFRILQIKLQHFRSTNIKINISSLPPPPPPHNSRHRNEYFSNRINPLHTVLSLSPHFPIGQDSVTWRFSRLLIGWDQESGGKWGANYGTEEGTVWYNIQDLNSSFYVDKSQVVYLKRQYKEASFLFTQNVG